MKPSYVGELEWALGEIRCRFNDRNNNRQAQVDAALRYAQCVSIARRGGTRIPKRPDLDKCV